MYLKIVVPIVLLATSIASNAYSQTSYQFVSTYVRELGAIESIRANAEAESKSANANTISDCIRNAERFQLELRSQISLMTNFNLPPEYKTLPSNIAQFYGLKLKIWQQISNACSTFMAGPSPNVDYGKLAAELPKLNAQLEYIDKALFEATPLIFATLINLKEDSQHHANHLVITRAERDTLARSINLGFGKKLDTANQNYIVSAASVLRSYLTEKGYKCSDEPWQ